MSIGHRGINRSGQLFVDDCTSVNDMCGEMVMPLVEFITGGGVGPDLDVVGIDDGGAWVSYAEVDGGVGNVNLNVWGDGGIDGYRAG